jgi:cellulose synthase/poly-beta-1,6-N-acetylglucosamine synthase-like glycosyltransferase
VLEQNYPAKRLIVIDNGSSDGTFDFALRLWGPARLRVHQGKLSLAKSPSLVVAS